MARILIVLTSQAKLGNTGEKTGFWFEELAAPYLLFKSKGYDVDIASIKGGWPPVDPRSLGNDKFPLVESVKEFITDPEAMKKLFNSTPIAKVKTRKYAAIMLPGGHGTMWDFPRNADLKKAVERINEDGRIVAALCHGLAGLVDAKAEDGRSLVSGRKVTSYTNEEEGGRAKVVPFLLENRLQKLGGLYSKAGKWKAYAITDGNLITGQNPMSSEMTAHLVVAALKESGGSGK